jgi:hypothetical protein
VTGKWSLKERKPVSFVLQNINLRKKKKEEDKTWITISFYAKSPLFK